MKFDLLYLLIILFVLLIIYHIMKPSYREAWCGPGCRRRRDKIREQERGLNNLSGKFNVQNNDTITTQGRVNVQNNKTDTMDGLIEKYKNNIDNLNKSNQQIQIEYGTSNQVKGYNANYHGGWKQNIQRHQGDEVSKRTTRQTELLGKNDEILLKIIEKVQELKNILNSMLEKVDEKLQGLDIKTFNSELQTFSDLKSYLGIPKPLDGTLSQNTFQDLDVNMYIATFNKMKEGIDVIKSYNEEQYNKIEDEFTSIKTTINNNFPKIVDYATYYVSVNIILNLNKSLKEDFNMEKFDDDYAFQSIKNTWSTFHTSITPVSFDITNTANIDPESVKKLMSEFKKNIKKNVSLFFDDFVTNENSIVDLYMQNSLKKYYDKIVVEFNVGKNKAYSELSPEDMQKKTWIEKLYNDDFVNFQMKTMYDLELYLVISKNEETINNNLENIRMKSYEYIKNRIGAIEKQGNVHVNQNIESGNV